MTCAYEEIVSFGVDNKGRPNKQPVAATASLREERDTMGDKIVTVHNLHSSQKYCIYNLGTKKEPKPKLFGPDIFRWGRGLPREGVGAKKVGMSLETREIKLFGRDMCSILVT